MTKVLEPGSFIVHKEFGAGKVIRSLGDFSEVGFEVFDKNLPQDKIATVKNNELTLFDELIKPGSRVKSKAFGYGTILENKTGKCIKQCLVRFDKEHCYLFSYSRNKNDKRNDKMWCVPKYNCYDGFMVVDKHEVILPRFSAKVILEDVYKCVKEDIPGRENNFMWGIKIKDMQNLEQRINMVVRMWVDIYGYEV